MKANDNKIFLGIDVSKKTLDISLSGKHYKINNSNKAILSFIKNNIAGTEISLAVLESTGGYEILAIKLLSEAGIAVHKAHPNKVHAFAKASGHFAKTDKLDAKLLARYASFIYEDDLPCAVFDKKILELQQLRSIERSLEDDLHAYQCRSDHLIGKALAIAKKQIKHIKNELLKVAKDIEDLIDGDDNLKTKKHLLTSYKGVGKKIANSLITELPELGKLDKKEIASLVGVAPRTHESGQKIGKGHIAGGRFYVRKAIYMAALVAMRYNAKMKKFYDELIAKGKPAKIALVAIMRKIIVCLNAMLKNNEFYRICS